MLKRLREELVGERRPRPHETVKHFFIFPMVHCSAAVPLPPWPRSAEEIISRGSHSDDLDLSAIEADVKIAVANESLKRLRGEKYQLLAMIEACMIDIAKLPLIEQEVLFHADRADTRERQVQELEARNSQLEVLAHARMRSQKQLQSAAQMRSLLRCSWSLLLAGALQKWRVAVLVLIHEPRDAELAQLQYQNLLLQRAAGQMLRQSKRELGATVMWQAYRRAEYSLIFTAWKRWVDVPRALGSMRFSAGRASSMASSSHYSDHVGPEHSARTRIRGGY